MPITDVFNEQEREYKELYKSLCKEFSREFNGLRVRVENIENDKKLLPPITPGGTISCPQPKL
jgi:hypothetical protein